MLEGLAAKHLKRHGGDAEKSLAAVSNAGRSTRESLAGIGDPDIEATLAQRRLRPRPTPATPNAPAPTPSAATTSDGQRFRVLRPHARGGLGAVFVALDEELNREVALKQILDHHADDPTSRTRFVLEAEITGGLEHPGIVPVYGLGSYGDGRPYYAMRFIRGDSLKDADRRVPRRRVARRPTPASGRWRCASCCGGSSTSATRSTTPTAAACCTATSSRPTSSSASTARRWWSTGAWPRPWARPEPGSTSDERTLMPSSASGSAETLPGSALGTPAYMSPEQAAGDLDRLGPRSDVYSLGATLYCLLTGKPPFEGDDLGAVLRAVQKGDFPPPRPVDPSIDRALEAVCLKAMALKPEDRYATRRALADDVERWAADEPVSAWREPWTRTLVRWLTRHRTGVTAAGAALLVALAGLAAVLGVEARANGQLTAKNAQLDAALVREADRFDLAMDAIKLFHGEVSEDLLLKEKKFEGLRRKLLRGAADFYGKLEGLLEGQPDPKSRAALAKSYSELADVTTQIGKGDEALALQLKALAVRRELASRPGADEGATLDLIRGLYSAARANLSLGDAAATLALIGEATTLAEGLEAKGQTSDVFRKRLAECLNYTAILLNENRPGIRNPAKAMEYNERSLAIAEELAAANPNENESNELLSAVVTHRGILLHDQGKWAEAVEAQRRAVGDREEAGGRQPQSPPNTGISWGGPTGISSASCRARASRPRRWPRRSSPWRAGRGWSTTIPPSRPTRTTSRSASMASATTSRRRGISPGPWRPTSGPARSCKALADADPSVVGYQRNLARSQSEIGWLRHQMGRYAEALPEYRQELETRRRMEAADPTNNGYRDDIANCETNIAAALLALGDPAGGRAACDHAIAIRRRLIESEPSNTDYRAGLGESLLRSGQLRRATGDIPGAAADWRQAVALFEGLPARVRRHRRPRGLLPRDALDPRRPPRLRRLRLRRPPRGRRGHGDPPPRRRRGRPRPRPAGRAHPRPTPRPPRLPRPADGRGLPGRPVRRRPLMAPSRPVTLVAPGLGPCAPSNINDAQIGDDPASFPGRCYRSSLSRETPTPQRACASEWGLPCSHSR